ncbi:hypothetical protein ASPWEDRAFT_32710 [Aspergillus wentii DTO 134E9]|uniref:Uncharacterized protein n=1 Tax=Aspergillus wentii DTO 134E9 TaxID=1073089 RepID=A0A1L9R6J3_ASPWE|nr:uncharacterized protein ASPWEDRAFT_32710 [Aspergillus wentii DTO 134E9]OJJ30542.1 hypothetical protein ASPWEDRAFT_32710 [Aspergillus wentii DTO 134E9]
MFSLSSILWVIPLLILTITACYQFKNIDHLFEALEDRFISNRPPWAAAIRKVAKFMTPFNKWRKQMRWFDKLYAAQQKEHSVFLREIYLRERGDLLRKRRDNPDGGGLTPAEKRILGMLEEEYTANEDRHEEAYVALFQTYTTRPSGAWIREYHNLTERQRWNRKVDECRAKVKERIFQFPFGDPCKSRSSLGWTVHPVAFLPLPQNQAQNHRNIAQQTVEQALRVGRVGSTFTYIQNPISLPNGDIMKMPSRISMAQKLAMTRLG